jgi:hypothetical protein
LDQQTDNPSLILVMYLETWYLQWNQVQKDKKAVAAMDKQTDILL